MLLKIFPDPSEGCEKFKAPRKAMRWKSSSDFELNEIGGSTINIYPTGINITRPECNQEVTLYPQELTSTLLIQKLSQVHLRGNTSNDYQSLQPFPSICKWPLTTPYQLLSIIGHCVLHRVVIGTNTTHP